MSSAIGKTKTRKVSKYTALLRVKSAVCKGKKSATDLKKAAATYAHDAEKKGKPKAAVMKTIARVTKMACGVSIAGTKRKTVKRKTTVRRKRA